MAASVCFPPTVQEAFFSNQHFHHRYLLRAAFLIYKLVEAVPEIEKEGARLEETRLTLRDCEAGVSGFSASK